jgi:hypothetical protein
VSPRLCSFAVPALLLALVGCATPGQSSAAFARPDVSRGAAILPAHGGDVLYISGTTGVHDRTYPRLKSRGLFGNFTNPGAECADGQGNFFIATAGVIFEYAHGGGNPIATINLDGVACSVDSLTGNLAVVTTDGLVLVYPPNPHGGWLQPHRFKPPLTPVFCGYDDAGNLFIDGLPNNVAELIRGRKTFAPIEFDFPLRMAGEIQWDGKHLTIANLRRIQAVIYRMAVEGNHARLLGKTFLKNSEFIRQTWIAGGFVVAGGNGRLTLWRYPAGGKPVRLIRPVTSYGLTVSVGT